VEEGRAILEDLESKNGTFLRGDRLDGPTELVDGDEFQLGDVPVRFRRYATPDSAAKQFIDPKMLADEALFVPDEVVAKLEPQKDNSGITQRQDIWAEFKSKIGQG